MIMPVNNSRLCLFTQLSGTVKSVSCFPPPYQGTIGRYK